ncbi:hypothetical protein [Caulobacter sp. UNC358MFTsu5.1]|uniref:hypothetical protein n=1 Tax=Caulobacter sp. UNC358MFTsu5.1 TaxID=1449049 RepID=UPI00069181AE|nr:hypothetical protein [Caulobacter sp. UNC358MFTsu5.1]
MAKLAHPREMKRILLPMLALAAGLLSTSCGGHVPAALPRAEAASCRAGGGYESRAAFGYPICQHDYADAGKVCSGKNDCQGGCLFDSVQGPATPVGTAVIGHCQPTAYYPGCYARVEGGKTSGPEICFD